MRLIEIQAGGGTVVIGQPAAIPRILRNADLLAERDHALFALWRNPSAAAQLRREWRHLVPGTDLHACSDAQLGELFAAALAARQLRAIFLKARLRSVAPAPLPQDNHRVVHLDLSGQTVLIAPAGQLPAGFRQQLDARKAAGLVAGIGDRHPLAASLTRQAGRVVKAGDGQRKASSLSRLVAQLLEAGVLEGAVIADPMAIRQAAGLGSAPTPVDRLHPYVRVHEALKLGLRQLPRELGDAAGSALVMDVGMFVAGAVPLQFAPVGGEIVEPALAGAAYAAGGVPGLDAMWKLIDATCAAGRARREDELGAAGQDLAAAFAAFGRAALAKLREMFIESVTADSGGVAEKPAAPAAASAPKPKAPSPVQQLASARGQVAKAAEQAKSTVAGLPAAAAAEAANELAEAKAMAEQAKQQLAEAEAAAEEKLAEARAEAEQLKQELEDRAKAELAELEAEAEKLRQAAEERLAAIKEKLAEYEALAQELRKLAEDNIPGAKEKLAELEAKAEQVKQEVEENVAAAQEKVAEARQEAEQRQHQAEQAADAAESAAEGAAAAAKSAADDLGNAL